MTRVALLAFEPFGGHTRNSSLEVGRAVARRPPRGVKVDWLVLPVVAGKCLDQAWAHIGKVRPSLVLALGQSGVATALNVERVAVNVQDFVIPDNAGTKVHDKPICPDGPAAYFTTIPHRRIVEDLVEHNIPVALSYSAGTYLCNYLLYGLLHRAAREREPRPTGFIHLPLLPGQNGARKRPPSAPDLKQMARGVRLAIAACLA